MLKEPITKLESIGEKRAILFRKLGIYTINDLLNHFPRDLKDKEELKKICDLKIGDTAIICAVISDAPDNFRFNNKIMTRAIVSDETGKMEMLWFNQSYMKNQLIKGEMYYFTGNVSNKYNKLAMLSPKIQKQNQFSEDMEIIPIYPSTSKLSQNIILKTVKNAMDLCLNEIEEILPDEILNRNQLLGKKEAVQNIHFPKNKAIYQSARKRLVFEELFMMQTALLRLKYKHTTQLSNTPFEDSGLIEEFCSNLTFTLTNAQKRALDETVQDLCKNKCMNRLIQGDVGSGKTVIAMAISYLTIKNGFQAAVMAPTEVLAKQHFESFKEIFQLYNIDVVLLTGSLNTKEKREAVDKIRSGECKMVIGTHALIQKSVIFNKLGLVVTDEQHRFGVNQRIALSEKGINTNVLIMSATPIPRTLALIIYGDLDISVIDMLPPGRKAIGTWAVDQRYRKRIFNFIRDEISKGRQAYIICPSIEKNENPALENILSVLEYTENMKKDAVLKQFNIECLHSKMKANQKHEILEDFAKGKIDILVSTTVVEVGINVPNATIMLIENAERFGLSQLHQLRGRIGRGTEQSYCILINNGNSSVSKQRMKIISETNDGFLISEKDLELRGSGDFFGVKQHGLPEFKIANLYRDMELLKLAQKEAEIILENDPLLQNSENQKLSSEINNIFKNQSQTVYL